MLKKILKNNHGASLVEILGALVILSIILIGFFSMFTQVGSMQNITEEEVVATNLIKVALEDVQSMESSASTLGTHEEFNASGLPTIPSVQQSGAFVANENYFLMLTLSDEEHSQHLLKATLQVMNKEGRKLAHTYTYIEVDQDE
ncbi:Tfp pilus assembly protein PilV [Alkalibacillus filiformis]|uniref:Tfp pilus assembly protein PilV n=1 Tax=Alkalibacillus filiformis TaxID=200990 RepID=A0ABU0DU60_9BACI|nr:prepilin-type N-terminal cleavage/methylation domain-containing protein [Alkalibacillus filiformis]MDQ0351993.1 Tfp pilus assembly protein PilV [Alkalibacillus filiformis]